MHNCRTNKQPRAGQAAATSSQRGVGKVKDKRKAQQTEALATEVRAAGPDHGQPLDTGAPNSTQKRPPHSNQGGRAAHRLRDARAPRTRTTSRNGSWWRGYTEGCTMSICTVGAPACYAWSLRCHLCVSPCMYQHSLTSRKLRVTHSMVATQHLIQTAKCGSLNVCSPG